MNPLRVLAAAVGLSALAPTGTFGDYAPKPSPGGDKVRTHKPDPTGNRCFESNRRAKCPKRGRLYWSRRR